MGGQENHIQVALIPRPPSPGFCFWFAFSIQYMEVEEWQKMGITVLPTVSWRQCVREGEVVCGLHVHDAHVCIIYPTHDVIHVSKYTRPSPA